MLEAVKAIHRRFSHHTRSVLELMEEYSPHNDSVTLQTSLQKAPPHQLLHLIMHLQELKLMIDGLITSSQTALHHAKLSSRRSTGRSISTTKTELARLMREVIAIHSYNTGIPLDYRVVWSSPSSRTIIKQVRNEQPPLQQLRQQENDYIFSYHLIFEGTELFKYEEYLWHDSEPQKREEELIIPQVCYDELTDFQNSVRVELFDEISRSNTDSQGTAPNGQTESGTHPLADNSGLAEKIEHG